MSGIDNQGRRDGEGRIETYNKRPLCNPPAKDDPVKNTVRSVSNAVRDVLDKK